jgi:hypothetical protein
LGSLDSLSGAGLRARARFVLRLVAGDGVLRHAEHLAVQQAVAGEVEGVDLDRGALAGMDEADVAV